MAQGFKTANAKAAVAASQTDSALVAAVAGKIIRVLSITMSAAATATASTFTTKPGGAGTAISAVFTNPVNTPVSLPYNPHGHFETVAGEGLSVTTGAGSTTNYQVCYELV